MIKRIKYVAAADLIAITVTSTAGCDILTGIMQYLGANFQSDGGQFENPVFDEYPPERISDDLPDRDFAGYEFTILSYGARYAMDIDALEQNGNVINDAVYMRNRRVEERYNVKITGVYENDPFTAVINDLHAAYDIYDLFALPMDTKSQMAMSGYMLDLYNVPYIDFLKPWWNRNANDHLSAAGKLYFAPNAIITSDKDEASVVLFGKNLCVDYGLDNPYELVMNGLWTADTMREMAKAVSVDLNGDGIMNAVNDRLGLLAGFATFYNSVISSGGAVITKDANGLPTAQLTERAVNSFHKWAEIYNDYMGAWTNTADFNEMFAAGRGLFMYEYMANVPELRRCEADFGILPHPKFSTADPAYIAPAGASGAAVGVPITYTDIERTGIILEALASESFYTLTRAYYDVLLKSKYYRDDESEIMLDIIFSNCHYNLGAVYNHGFIDIIDEKFNSLAAENNENIVAAYETIDFSVQQRIDKIINYIAALN